MVGSVKCETIEQFIQVCAGFVREGVIFKADAASLVVTLTGGY